MHKLKDPSEIPKFRPILSAIGSYNYNLAKYLNSLLCPHIPSEYSCSDTFQFANQIRDLDIANSYLVSFDVESLFTNVPVKETTEIAIDIIMENHPNFKISRPQLRKLFSFATSQTHFLFDGEYFDQIDGLSMGSPLGPTMANIFMGKNEKDWIDGYQGQKPLFYRRYIDDIFCAFENETQVSSFFEYLNTRHSNIKFTLEKENQGALPFLDVLVKRIDGGCFTTTTYRKSTFTGLLTNFKSFVSFCYKKALVKTLFDRATKINSTEDGLNQDKKVITDTLLRNSFPRKLIENIKNAQSLATHENQVVSAQQCRYFKLPYIGSFSTEAKRKLQQLASKYCKSVKSFKVIFTSQKIGSFFSSKQQLEKGQVSKIVYQFRCAGCNTRYIGETTRCFHTRAQEHLATDKKSVVFKHLKKMPLCKKLCDVSCFSILDKADTKYALKIKEAFHIGKQKPELNLQVKSLQVALVL